MTSRRNSLNRCVIVLATRTTNTTNTNVTTAGRWGATSKPVWPSGGSGRLSRDWLTPSCAGCRPWNAALPRSSFDTGAPETLPSEGRTSGFEADERDSRREHHCEQSDVATVGIPSHDDIGEHASKAACWSRRVLRGTAHANDRHVRRLPASPDAARGSRWRRGAAAVAATP